MSIPILLEWPDLLLNEYFLPFNLSRQLSDQPRNTLAPMLINVFSGYDVNFPTRPLLTDDDIFLPDDLTFSDVGPFLSLSTGSSLQLN